MKWFQHETAAHNDEIMRDLVHQFGMEGYGVYFLILELVAEKIDEKIQPEIRIRGSVLREKSRVSHQKLTKILAFFDRNLLIFSNFQSDYWSIKCPNLTKRLDNWTKRSVSTTEQLPLQSDQKEKRIRKESEVKPDPLKLGKEKTEELRRYLLTYLQQRGWHEVPGLLDEIFYTVAREVEKQEPRKMFPYFQKSLTEYVNQNAEYLSGKVKRWRDKQ